MAERSAHRPTQRRWIMLAAAGFFALKVGVLPVAGSFAGNGLDPATDQDDLAARDQQRPALGIRIGQDPQGRILIAHVEPGSTAAEAGLQVGDEIVAFGQSPVRSTAEMTGHVQQARIGESWALQFRRDGQGLTAGGPMGSYVGYFGRADLFRGAARPAVGIRVRAGAAGRLEVTEVIIGSPAEAAGVRGGDVILSVGGRPIRSYGELVTVLDEARAGHPIRLQLTRNGQETNAEPIVSSYAAMDNGLPR
jgi:S1-C subfamily serine protease